MIRNDQLFWGSSRAVRKRSDNYRRDHFHNKIDSSLFSRDHADYVTFLLPFRYRPTGVAFTSKNNYLVLLLWC